MCLCWCVLFLVPLLASADATDPLIVTRSIVLEAGEVLHTPLVIAADNITVEGRGAILQGPGIPGSPATHEGIGIYSAGNSRVTLRDLTVMGFKTGLWAQDGDRWVIEGCSFSDNYNDPESGSGEGERGGGMVLTGIAQSRICNNVAGRVWNGSDLLDCHDNEISGNVFSPTSNWSLKLRRSCRNRVMNNDLSHARRAETGQTHSQGPAGLLIENGSDDNFVLGNDIAHGGDGIWIRADNGWVSTGNVFVENDCSWASRHCIRSNAPGNTFIRNRANHGSSGFWMGGSDRCVLIENEASFNGVATGSRSAPEPVFGHGGIVFVDGTSYHTRVIGNRCHDNAGGGIVVRGATGCTGARWLAHHWIITDNWLERNRWGIWAEQADWLFLARNTSLDNTEEDHFRNVTNMTVAPFEPGEQPTAVIEAPNVMATDQMALINGSESVGSGLAYQWDIGGSRAEGAQVRLTFPRWGLYRIGLTVISGDRADLAWRELYVVHPAEQPATEGSAQAWSCCAWEDGLERGVAPSIRPQVTFSDDREIRLAGDMSLRMRVEGHEGAVIEASAPASLFGLVHGARKLSAWIKWRNENALGFKGTNPVAVARTPGGSILIAPEEGRNLLGDVEHSESRWGWAPVSIPLQGGEAWVRSVDGAEEPVIAFGLGFAPSGPEPFTVWIDGLVLE